MSEVVRKITNFETDPEINKTGRWKVKIEQKPLQGGGESSTNAGLHQHRTMANNILSNLRSCVKEFDTEQTADVQNLCKRFESWLTNFEACAEFEDVPTGKKKPALLAVGGEKLRELCTTLQV
jgi:hypothetical protein